MDDEAGFAGPLGLGLFGGAFAPAPGVGIINSIATKSYAGFGEGTFAFTDATRLTLGARYTRDERERTGETHVLSGITNSQVLAVVPTTTVEKTFEEPTYRAILDHRFSDEVMVYGSYSRGFKSGNFKHSAGDRSSVQFRNSRRLRARSENRPARWPREAQCRGIQL